MYATDIPRSEIAEEVQLPASDEEKQHLADMIEFVKNSQNPELAEKYKLRPGVGLAAPQTDVKTDDRRPCRRCERHFIQLCSFNPKIVSHSVEKAT